MWILEILWFFYTKFSKIFFLNFLNNFYGVYFENGRLRSFPNRNMIWPLMKIVLVITMHIMNILRLRLKFNEIIVHFSFWRLWVTSRTNSVVRIWSKGYTPEKREFSSILRCNLCRLVWTLHSAVCYHSWWMPHSCFISAKIQRYAWFFGIIRETVARFFIPCCT